jgi:ABC-type glycerol-3-phosphate transport system permease component
MAELTEVAAPPSFARPRISVARSALHVWALALGVLWLVPLLLIVITPMKSTPEYQSAS